MSFGESLQRFLKDNRDNPALHVVKGSDLGEDALPLPEAPIGLNLSPVVEGSSLEQKPLEPDGESRFTHFLDGIQRSRVVAYWEGVPLVRGYASGCVRWRCKDRFMHADERLKEQREALIFPFRLVPPNAFRDSGMLCLDSLARIEPEKVDEHPLALMQLAKDMLDSERSNIERRLTQRWVDQAQDGQWLVIDGSLSTFQGGDAYQRVIGVIKSHRTRYFAGEEYGRVLSLPLEARTSVFQPRRQGQPVYSWYLRLRDNDGEDLAFGLVRIEATGSDETIGLADEISRWILAERSPVSLPDSRWDRMIYPIRDCEQYLRSIAPSKVDWEARAWM